MSLLPLPRHSALMSDGEHRRDFCLQQVVHRIGKVAQVVVPHFVFVRRTHVGVLAECVNCSERFIAESIRRNRASLEVSKKRIADLRLGWRQNFNHEARHSALSRARASAQGAAFKVPSRNACLRSRSSLRQASGMAASVLPSKLSSNATTRAERSSVGRFKASASN